MAKMMPKRERKMRKIVGRMGRGILEMLEAEEIIKAPHKYALKKMAEKMAKADKMKMRRGRYKDRYQFQSGRNRRYYVKSIKKNRILYGGKKTPYKNIPVIKSRKHRRK